MARTEAEVRRIAQRIIDVDYWEAQDAGESVDSMIAKIADPDDVLDVIDGLLDIIDEMSSMI